MKRFTWLNLLGAGALALTLAIAPSVPASAQDATTPATGTDVPVVDEGDNDFDWGWLGLLGLIGLAGLARRNDDSTRYRDREEVGTTTRY